MVSGNFVKFIAFEIYQSNIRSPILIQVIDHIFGIRLGQQLFQFAAGIGIDDDPLLFSA
ncbi:hypothetical protein D3C81_2156980 [compost metagenome]